MMRPALSCVRALNALQNSMMLTPCWPSAGPTGGDGFAAPAGHCSLTMATTFFANLLSLAGVGGRMRRPPRPMALSGLFHVRVVEHHGGGPAEHLDHHPDLLLVRKHLVDEAREVRERAGHHPHALALLEADLRLGLDRAFL